MMGVVESYRIPCFSIGIHNLLKKAAGSTQILISFSLTTAASGNYERCAKSYNAQ
jgi:hypothetical protein